MSSFLEVKRIRQHFWSDPSCIVVTYPEGTKRHPVVPRRVLDHRRVNGVVSLGGAGRDACGAVIGPAAVLHGRRSGVADGR